MEMTSRRWLEIRRTFIKIHGNRLETKLGHSKTFHHNGMHIWLAGQTLIRIQRFRVNAVL